MTSRKHNSQPAIPSKRPKVSSDVLMCVKLAYHLAESH